MGLLAMMRWMLFLGVGFYLCSILTLLPLAADWQWYRPLWLLLFVIYCQLAQPGLFNPCWAWLIGLLLDGLLSSPLGVHACAFSVVSYLTAFFRGRFGNRPIALQMGKVFLLVAIGQMLILWFHAFFGKTPHTLWYWMGTLTSTLAWPFMAVVFHLMRRLLGLPFWAARAS